MWDALTSTVGIYGATLVVAALSGIIPIINAEVYLVAVALLTRSVPLAIVLGLIVAAGQMIAKIGIYKAFALGADKAATKPKYAAKLEKAQKLMEKWKDKPLVLTFVSASVGLPPFFIVSALAGMLKINFKAFMLLGFLGRSIRFCLIAVLAVLAQSAA